jgi:hypothetical protein
LAFAPFNEGEEVTRVETWTDGETTGEFGNDEETETEAEELEDEVVEVVV